MVESANLIIKSVPALAKAGNIYKEANYGKKAIQGRIKEAA